MTVTHEACVIEATHLGLRDIGPWLDDVFARAGWTESPSRATTELAVHELAANVVDHARPADGVVSLSAHGEPDTLTITTVDTGAAFDHEEHVAPDPNEPQVRGYGLMIVEQVAEAVHYERLDGGNRWTATFRIAPPDDN